MFDTDVVLEALNALCNAGATSAQRQISEAGQRADISGGAAQLQQSMTELSIHDLIFKALSCRSRFTVFSQEYQQQDFWGGNQHLKSAFQSPEPVCDFSLPKDIRKDNKTGDIIIEPKQHLDPQFDYDFTKLRDTEDYCRGGEKYIRPCGWQRFALKVLDEYGDNTWLGNNNHRTQSVPGEWPVSYHGTREEFVKSIIEKNYKKGARAVHGPGIYSTPNIDEADLYAREFTSESTGKKYKTVLQNRINPKYREICKSRKDYWLVRIDEGTSEKMEKEIVRKAIRPYGVLVKEM
ncbi:uncharacterized protein LOC144521849 [Sander vitreus]